MLEADEIEMVQLASVWIETNTPQRTWQDYMSLILPRFTSRVEMINGKPTIKVIDIYEIWTTSYTGGNVRRVKVNTGYGGYQLFTNTLKIKN